jgi:hypothetical protein
VTWYLCGSAARAQKHHKTALKMQNVDKVDFIPAVDFHSSR